MVGAGLAVEVENVLTAEEAQKAEGARVAGGAQTAEVAHVT